jgi:hypothetical protein
LKSGSVVYSRIFLVYSSSMGWVAAAGNSAEPLLQPHIIQPERVRYGIHTVLPGQFDRSLPQ